MSVKTNKKGVRFPILKNIFYGLLIFSLILGLSGSVSAANCGSLIKTCDCGDTLITSYTLTAADSVTTAQCMGGGLTIGANNIILDCDGRTINGSYSSSGIYLSGKIWNTIRNCVITGFNSGIYLHSSSNNNIINNAANSNWFDGITLSNSNRNNIINNLVDSNSGWETGHGITLSNSNSNSITSNIVNSNNLYGIFLYNSSKNNIISNTVNSTWGGGFTPGIGSGIFLLYYSNNNIIENNTANSNKHGIFINLNSDFNNLINNKITNSTNTGVYFSSDSNKNALTKNLICSNGLDVNDSDSNSGDNNTCDTTHNWNDSSAITKCTNACNEIIECTANTNCSFGEYCSKAAGDCTGSGTCDERPKICPLFWAPVCGCDGSTYSNSCVAASNGVNVEYEGACVTACSENTNCSSGEYCSKAAGDCNGNGTCETRPEICIALWAPVCGCDGSTYSNSCVAASNGVNVEYEGECITACSENTNCSSGEYCSKAVGDCDGNGTCETMPEICIALWAPVCGCDGSTYSNSCVAASNGVNVEYGGECIVPVCFNNSECSSGEYCSKAAGDCDGNGTCETMPEICIALWDPVCGCDGSTYSNSCVAASNGVNVEYEGECIVPVCFNNSECSSGEYCSKAAEDCDGNGICETMPEICIALWAPVCGCDGSTYSNSCVAASNGVNVEYEGECIVPVCFNNSECSSGEYCSKAAGDCNGNGTCETIPLGCPDVWAPVCGCDGSTYSNACDAASSGVNVGYAGECINACSENSNCSFGEYCSKAAGDCTGSGTCETMPEICIALWAPVCGCDGSTYGNSCVAASNGVNVEYDDECIVDKANITYTLTSNKVSPGGTTSVNVDISSPLGVGSSQIKIGIPSDLKIGTATMSGFVTGSMHMQSGNEHRWFQLAANGDNVGSLSFPVTVPLSAIYGTQYTINLTGVDLKGTNEQIIHLNQQFPLTQTIVVCPTVQDIFDALDSYFGNEPSPLCGGNVCTVADIFLMLDDYFAC